MSTEPEREFVGNGRFALDQILGNGGVGVVVLAYDIEKSRWDAMKRIPSTDPEVLREAANIVGLEHPNIASVHEVFQEGAEILVSMEFVQGQALGDLVEPMTEETFRDFAAQCLEGLRAAHEKNIIHRGLKPGNIMLAALPEGGFQVKLLDFGQSRLREALLQTPAPGGVSGGLAMMAPEQLRHQEVDARADFYSLGCVFYQALTRQFPFTGENAEQLLAAQANRSFQPLASLRPDLPASLTAWVERMFAQDRNDRPANALEALQALRSTHTADSPDQATPVVAAAPSLKATPAVDLSAATMRVVLPLQKSKVPTPVAATAQVVKPASVATAVKPAASAASVRVSAPSSLRTPEPEPTKKFPVPLWIPLAAAAVLLIAGGVFFISGAMAPKGELAFGEDLSNGVFPPGTWTISDGIMKGNGKSDSLWTKKEYENFELHFEVRVAPKSNSGIFLRCPSVEELRQKRLNYRQSALEVEIVEGEETAGYLLTVAKPAKPIKLSPGKWHAYDIKANGSTISVAVDGTKLYDLDLSKGTKPSFNPDGTRNILPIALKDLPKKGRIGIQDWLGPVEYRNFRIKEL